MPLLSSNLFSLGVILVALGFAAHVGHAVMLANGRRLMPSLATARAPGRQPAYAGVVTGSFVTEQTLAASSGLDTYASPSPLSRAAIGLTFLAFLSLGGSMLARAIVVGRGPWGSLYEFSVAFAFSMLGGYLFLQRRYPIRSIGFIPVGVALAILLYASSLPGEIQPLVPALQNAPLLTIHVGMAVISYGIFATSFAAGVGYLVQGQTDRYSLAPVAQGPRRGRVPRGHHRLPALRHDDHPRLVVGVDRLVALLGLGPEGDRGARHVADLRDLPPRPQPALVGRPARGAPPRRRVRDGPRDLFRLAVVQRPARLQRALSPFVEGPSSRRRSARRLRSSGSPC